MQLKFLKGKLVAGVVTLLIAALVLVACGAKAPPAPTTPPPPPPAPPAGNQPPVISNLNLATPQTVPGGTVRVQCVASDPEGETLSYKWSATGGSFDTAVGPIVTWIAPSIYGNYDITITVSDPKAAMTQQTVVITVVANQNPSISSLVADPSVVVLGPGPGSISVITCIASDPDDVLNPSSYSWTATEGSITGVGNKVTWQAPVKGGDYYVKVTVNDGRGGSSTQQVLIRVASAEMTVVVNVTQGETGTVWDNGFVESRLVAGDNEANNTARAFFSFNISTFAGKKVTSAKLAFSPPSVTGNPFPATSLNGLFVEEVRYGAKALQPVDFNIPGTSLMPAYMAAPTEIDVTSQVAWAANAAANLFQVRTRFNKLDNGNNVADYIEFTTATLTVTYEYK